MLRGKRPHLKVSENEYDWLGSGVYFWESDPWRALAFAHDAMKNSRLSKGKIKKPYVVGAVIDLGVCCNLLEVDALDEVARASELLTAAFKAANVPLPRNSGAGMGYRRLDRAVIEQVHVIRTAVDLPSYDSVRAAFIEGEPLYKGAGFNRKNHIQLAVRNLDCIKGYFRLPGL